MKQIIEKKPGVKSMDEKELEQVNGGIHDWTSTHSEPKPAGRNEDPVKDTFPGLLTLLSQNSAENERKDETLSETENVTTVRSNNIRNRRV